MELLVWLHLGGDRVQMIQILSFFHGGILIWRKYLDLAKQACYLQLWSSPSYFLKQNLATVVESAYLYGLWNVVGREDLTVWSFKLCDKQPQ